MTDARVEDLGLPFIDVDEQRSTPLPHRFVHGGFEGTTVRFRIRFPVDGYRGRMLQVLGGGQGGTELITDDEAGEVTGVSPYRGLEEAAHRGAFIVESNEGFRAGVDTIPDDLTLIAYRATAATARYAIELATEHYGSPPRWRYLAGFSGGGVRTVNALEHTEGIFDGGVAGGLTSLGTNLAGWSTVAHVQHVLRDVLEEFVGNADAGGTGDLFAAARTEAHRAAIRDLYGAGYPAGNEHGLLGDVAWIPGWHYLPFVDPTYEQDFFGLPGYAGHDTPVERVRGEATVVDVLEGDAGVRGVRLDIDLAPAELVGAAVAVVSGPRAGAPGVVTSVSDDLPPGFLALPRSVDALVGDRVSFDNSRWLALRHYHRDLHRRPAARYTASLDYTGVHTGKLVVVQQLHDHLTLTTATLAHASRIVAPDRYRLWWIEYGDHAAASARVIDIAPSYHRALDDLIAWVEDGVEPRASTPYEVDADGILHLPESAAERGGIQPTVTLEANGERRPEVPRGAPLTLRVTAEAPADDEIVEIAWDPHGTAEWEAETTDPARSVALERTQVYAEPGVVLAGVRVRSRGRGSRELLDNLSHARIVVVDEQG